MNRGTVLLVFAVIIVGILLALALVDSDKELNRGPFATTTTTANHVQTTETNPTQPSSVY